MIGHVVPGRYVMHIALILVVIWRRDPGVWWIPVRDVQISQFERMPGVGIGTGGLETQDALLGISGIVLLSVSNYVRTKHARSWFRALLCITRFERLLLVNALLD